jgi:dephospho-CoA kinase
MIEAGWNDLMDVIWVVEVDRELALERLMKRNQLTSEQAEIRLNAQLSNEERRKYATNVINNMTDQDLLEGICRYLWDKLETR